jgi:hypothetical protein
MELATVIGSVQDYVNSLTDYVKKPLYKGLLERHLLTVRSNTRRSLASAFGQRKDLTCEILSRQLEGTADATLGLSNVDKRTLIALLKEVSAVEKKGGEEEKAGDDSKTLRGDSDSKGSHSNPPAASKSLGESDQPNNKNNPPRPKMEGQPMFPLLNETPSSQALSDNTMALDAGNHTPPVIPMSMSDLKPGSIVQGILSSYQNRGDNPGSQLSTISESDIDSFDLRSFESKLKNYQTTKVGGTGNPPVTRVNTASAGSADEKANRIQAKREALNRKKEESMKLAADRAAAARDAEMKAEAAKKAEEADRALAEQLQAEKDKQAAATLMTKRKTTKAKPPINKPFMESVFWATNNGSPSADATQNLWTWELTDEGGHGDEIERKLSDIAAEITGKKISDEETLRETIALEFEEIEDALGANTPMVNFVTERLMLMYPELKKGDHAAAGNLADSRPSTPPAAQDPLSIEEKIKAVEDFETWVRLSENAEQDELNRAQWFVSGHWAEKKDVKLIQELVGLLGGRKAVCEFVNALRVNEEGDGPEEAYINELFESLGYEGVEEGDYKRLLNEWIKKEGNVMATHEAVHTLHYGESEGISVKELTEEVKINRERKAEVETYKGRTKKVEAKKEGKPEPSKADKKENVIVVSEDEIELANWIKGCAELAANTTDRLGWMASGKWGGKNRVEETKGLLKLFLSKERVSSFLQTLPVKTANVVNRAKEVKKVLEVVTKWELGVEAYAELIKEWVESEFEARKAAGTNKKTWDYGPGETCTIENLAGVLSIFQKNQEFEEDSWKLTDEKKVDNSRESRKHEEQRASKNVYELFSGLDWTDKEKNKYLVAGLRRELKNEDELRQLLSYLPYTEKEEKGLKASVRSLLKKIRDGVEEKTEKDVRLLSYTDLLVDWVKYVGMSGNTLKGYEGLRPIGSVEELIESLCVEQTEEEAVEKDEVKVNNSVSKDKKEEQVGGRNPEENDATAIDSNKKEGRNVSKEEKNELSKKRIASYEGATVAERKDKIRKDLKKVLTDYSEEAFKVVDKVLDDWLARPKSGGVMSDLMGAIKKEYRKTLADKQVKGAK